MRVRFLRRLAAVTVLSLAGVSTLAGCCTDCEKPPPCCKKNPQPPKCDPCAPMTVPAPAPSAPVK